MHALSRQHWAHISSLFSFDRVLFPMYTKIKVNLVMCCGCLFVGVRERDGDKVPNEKLYHEFIWEAGLSRWCSLPT